MGKGMVYCLVCDFCNSNDSEVLKISYEKGGDVIKEVKKILDEFEEENQHFRGISCTMYHEVAKQICQLFEPSKYSPVTTDMPHAAVEQAFTPPEPDKSRLLTAEELKAITYSRIEGRYRDVSKAQDAKTASIVRQEMGEEMMGKRLEILEWLRIKVRQLEQKYPQSDTEAQGWIGTFLDLIRQAGKEIAIEQELKRKKPFSLGCGGDS